MNDRKKNWSWDFWFLGHFWPNFQTFCVLGTQNFNPDLIMTFADGLVEVEVTRGSEVVPNWPLSFSAISGPIFKLFASLLLRISRPIRIRPLHKDILRSTSLGSAPKNSDICVKKSMTYIVGRLQIRRDRVTALVLSYLTWNRSWNHAFDSFWWGKFPFYETTLVNKFWAHFY